MDTQTLINIAAGIIIAGMGWLARELWGAVKELRKDLHTIEVALPSNYIRKDEFRGREGAEGHLPPDIRPARE